MELIKLSDIDDLNITSVRKIFINDMRLVRVHTKSKKDNLYLFTFLAHQDLFDEYFRIDTLVRCDNNDYIENSIFYKDNPEVTKILAAIPKENRMISDFSINYTGTMYCSMNGYARTDIEQQDLFKNVKTYENFIIKLQRDMFISISLFFANLLTYNTIKGEIFDDLDREFKYIPFEELKLDASTIVPGKEKGINILTKFTGRCGPKFYNFVFSLAFNDKTEEDIKLHIPLPNNLFLAEYGQVHSVDLIYTRKELLLVDYKDAIVYVLRGEVLEKSAFTNPDKIYKLKEI
jgi:hypothetical protein